VISIPEAFAAGTRAREGQAGRDWVAGLPALVDELLQRWDRSPVGEALHGQVGLVVPVRPTAVLKVSFPHPGNVHEPHAFAAWNGHGAVRLYERDDSCFAMLLEQARSETLADVTDTDEAVAIAGRLARRLAVPAPAGLPRLSDQAEQWQRELQAAPDILPRRTVEAAISTFRELGPDQPGTLVHGDLHDTNILRSDREPWLAIDPKGQIGDLGHDALALLRTRFGDLLAAPDLDAALLRRLAVFTEAAETDPDRTRRWTQARAVRAAAWGHRHGDPSWLIQLTEQIAELLLPG
jgi:streptomycin 6-kinase